MNINQLIRLCKMYAREGSSIWDQLDDVMDGADMDDLNPNALKIIQRFFQQAERMGVDDAEGMQLCIEEHLDGLDK